MDAKHTPTPWKTNGKSITASNGGLIASTGFDVADEGRLEDAQFIVRAVNAHKALFNACVMACASMDELASNAGDVEEWNDGGHAYTALDMLRAAIAKAKGE